MYKSKSNKVGEIKALLKYLVGSMSPLAKLVLPHLQSVNTPTEHNPNLLPSVFMLNPNPSLPLQSYSGLLSVLLLVVGEQLFKTVGNPKLPTLI